MQPASPAQPVPAQSAASRNNANGLQPAPLGANAGNSSANIVAPGDVDVDTIINRLLEVRGSRPGKQVNLAEAEIRYYKGPLKKLKRECTSPPQQTFVFYSCTIGIYALRAAKFSCHNQSFWN